MTTTVTGTAQHEAWLARRLPAVEQISPDVWSVPVPMPGPLRWVNVYAFGGSNGLVLVDAGWDSDDAWQALAEGLRAIGAAPGDVRGVLVTHMHLDHGGLAGRLREASGAWVAMHPADRDLMLRPDYRGLTAAMASKLDHYRRLGASDDEARAVLGGHERHEAQTRAAAPDRELHDGDQVEVPGRSLRVLHTPGHTPGHVCFVDEQLDTVFAGDHLLPRITPNISTERGGPPDPLGDYLDSLDRIDALGEPHVAPAHEWRFDGVAVRVGELRVHHDRRLAEIVDAVGRRPGITAWETAGMLTWSRPWSDYDGRMRVLAVTETMAHLRRLVATGAVRSDGAPTPRFEEARS